MEYCLMMDDRFEKGNVLYDSYKCMYNDVKSILIERNFPLDEMEDELDSIDYLILNENQLSYLKYDHDLRKSNLI